MPLGVYAALVIFHAPDFWIHAFYAFGLRNWDPSVTFQYYPRDVSYLLPF
jgi:hypothetical protein